VKEEEALDEFTEGDALAVRGGFGDFERFGFEGQVELTLAELGFEFGAGHGDFRLLVPRPMSASGRPWRRLRTLWFRARTG